MDPLTRYVKGLGGDEIPKFFRLLRAKNQYILASKPPKILLENCSWGSKNAHFFLADKVGQNPALAILSVSELAPTLAHV